MLKYIRGVRKNMLKMEQLYLNQLIYLRDCGIIFPKEGERNVTEKQKTILFVQCFIYAENFMAWQQRLCHIHIYKGIQRERVLDDIFSVSDRVDICCDRKQNAFYRTYIICRGNVYRAYLHSYYGGDTSAL